MISGEEGREKRSYGENLHWWWGGTPLLERAFGPKEKREWHKGGLNGKKNGPP